MKTLKELYAMREAALKKCEAVNDDENATVEELVTARNELQTIDARIELAEEAEASGKKTAAKKIDDNKMKKLEDDEGEGETTDAEYEKAFYAVLQGRRITAEQRDALISVNNALSVGTDEDGGYLIPSDQQTAIRELMRQMKSLEAEVNVEKVTTSNGTRLIEKDAEFTPFTVVAEGVDIPETDSPQWVAIAYAILDRMGILPIPNNLLKDNTANLKVYLNKWLAKKMVATRNSLIATLMASLTPTAIADFDDVKDICNVQLDPSISDEAFVYTNQDGFNALDKMKDPEGNYWLQPNPAKPTEKMLNGKVVKVYSNKTLPTAGTTTLLAPVYIGLLKETVTLFDREALSLLATDIGGDAFVKNRTNIRAISREDAELVDVAALVFGQIDVTAA